MKKNQLVELAKSLKKETKVLKKKQLLQVILGSSADIATGSDPVAEAQPNELGEPPAPGKGIITELEWKYRLELQRLQNEQKQRELELLNEQ